VCHRARERHRQRGRRIARARAFVSGAGRFDVRESRAIDGNGGLIPGGELRLGDAVPGQREGLGIGELGPDDVAEPCGMEEAERDGYASISSW